MSMLFLFYLIITPVYVIANSSNVTDDPLCLSGVIGTQLNTAGKFSARGCTGRSMGLICFQRSSCAHIPHPCYA